MEGLALKGFALQDELPTERFLKMEDCAVAAHQPIASPCRTSSP